MSRRLVDLSHLTERYVRYLSADDEVQLSRAEDQPSRSRLTMPKVACPSLLTLSRVNLVQLILHPTIIVTTTPLILPSCTTVAKRSPGIRAAIAREPYTKTIAMAAVARTPGRSLRVTSSAATEPPNKRRKYIPAGLGGVGGKVIRAHATTNADPVRSGGGRWIDSDGNDVTNMALTAPRPRNPRSHSSRSRLNDESGETPTTTRSAMRTRPRREGPRRYAPPTSSPRPRYSNAAAAAAASQASDGYKPREERSWEDFHPDLDIDAALIIFTADEVDGRKRKDAIIPSLAHSLSMISDTNAGGTGVQTMDAPQEDGAFEDSVHNIVVTPAKRKPGRPPRRPESMLSGLGSPPAPRILPLPTHNPKERLNLPKPSFRHENHFLQYEDDQKENKINYVDRTMSSIGYQESDRFDVPSRFLIRLIDGQQVEDEAEVSLHLESDGPLENLPANPVVGRVEYDMDEQDVAWLEELNEQRKLEGVDAIKPAIFEITMTQIEKEYHALERRIPKPQPRHAQTHRPRSSSQAAVNGDPLPGDEPDSKCSICDDGDCENANAIIFCDGCDLAVHQECYGVPFIPEGQWFCRKCKEIGRGTPTCIFCPNVDGAFKQTSTRRWSHLLCSIWIPEVTIANATFMEPITDVDKVPKGRWKLNCYICNQKMGAENSVWKQELLSGFSCYVCQESQTVSQNEVAASSWYRFQRSQSLLR
nr:isoform 2 of peregrin [Quercus suber]